VELIADVFVPARLGAPDFVEALGIGVAIWYLLPTIIRIELVILS